MIRYRARIDVENLKVRLSRGMGVELADAEVVAWLGMVGIRREYPLSPLCWVGSEDALDVLRPWEILERLPVLILPGEGIPAGIGI
jgi:hypothetical protein